MKKNQLIKYFKSILFFLVFALTSLVGNGQTITAFTSSTTWACPAGVTSIKVEAWGGGGGGGGATSGTSGRSGGGGAGGAYVKNTSVTVTPGTTYTITIGAGGTAGTGISTSVNGGPGGNSSFSGGSVTIITSTGGPFGTGGTGTTVSGAGGTGSSTSNAGFEGSFSYAGGNGAAGVGGTTSGGGGGAAGPGGGGGNASLSSGGTGNGTGSGNGANGVAPPTAGSAPTSLTYGGGGSGGATNNTGTKLGGAGAGGRIVLTYTSVSPTIAVTPTSLSGFSTSTTSVSSAQSFSISGTNLTGNISINAPTDFEINNPAVNATYSSSLSLTQTGNSVASTNINVRLKSGLASAAYIENITTSSPSANNPSVLCNGTVLAYYYYNGTGSLAAVANWNSNTSGSGGSLPTDFITNYQVFIIKNTTAVSTDVPWTVGGTSSKIFVGDATASAVVLTITSGASITATIGVTAAATGNNEIRFQDVILPTLSGIDATANLTYATGATPSISGASCNKLTITNNTAATLATSVNIKFLQIDAVSSLSAISSNLITLATGGTAIINGSITGARSQGIFTTDATSVNKGTIFSADITVTITLGSNSTVIYNRTSAQVISPLTYANLTVGFSSSLTPGTIAAATSVSGILTVGSGASLATGGFLTLKSTALSTASIANSAGSITGNVTVERYIPSLSRRKFILVSSPVTSTINAGWQEGATGGAFVAGAAGYGTAITKGVAQGTLGFDGPATSGASIFIYNDNNASGSKWIADTTTTGTNKLASLAPGTGYLVFVRGDRSVDRPTTGTSSNTTLRATGVVGQGSVSPILLATASQYTLIANPYPCAIDWTSANITKTNLSSSFTVYDPNLGVFVSSDGTTISPNQGNQQAAYIQSGQAFFVQAASTAATAITFTEAAKTLAATTTSATTVFGANDNEKAQLNINTYRTVGNVFADGAVALFGKAYSAAVDTKEDIMKFTNFNETFSLRRNNQALGLEARPTIASNDTLFIGMSNFGKRDYSLVVDASNFKYATASLEDNYAATKTTLDLTASTTYKFTVNGDAASATNDRFMITFGSTAPATVIADAAAAGLYVRMSPNPVVNQLQISFKTAAAAQTTINIINTLGQIVKTVNAGNVDNGNINIPVSSLSNGIYTVQILSGDKQICTQKIVKE